MSIGAIYQAASRNYVTILSRFTARHAVIITAVLIGAWIVIVPPTMASENMVFGLMAISHELVLMTAPVITTSASAIRARPMLREALRDNSLTLSMTRREIIRDNYDVLRKSLRAVTWCYYGVAIAFSFGIFFAGIQPTAPYPEPLASVTLYAVSVAAYEIIVSDQTIGLGVAITIRLCLSFRDWSEATLLVGSVVATLGVSYGTLLALTAMDALFIEPMTNFAQSDMGIFLPVLVVLAMHAGGIALARLILMDGVSQRPQTNTKAQ